MDDRIKVLISSFRLQLELLLIFLRDLIKFFIPTSPKSLKNEVILVTGGSNGIGREILRRLAQEEHELTLISWDVNEEANKEVVKELEELGAKRAVAYNVDVTNRDQVSKTAAEIRRNYGDVTMLFNNAGITGPAGNCWQIDINHALKTLDINLNSHLHTVQEFLPPMLRKQRGHIIGTCSILSFLEGAHGLPYCVSKHGLRAFYECLKADLRKSGSATDINVTSVYPGFVATDLIAPFNFDSKLFPVLSRPVSPEMVASEVVKGIRQNKEHIYVLSFWRFVHTFMSIIPSSMNAAATDAVNIDPLNPKVAPAPA